MYVVLDRKNKKSKAYLGSITKRKNIVMVTLDNLL